ncbi:hypothetical protein J1614_003142 [Plenodomus biglobosus]|nr:hypothetical protein J1614_003142 [Plenodomus biglobosus]
MPRPCQKRRESAAANRKPKPAAPPPIRHKARQKAIHNARRGRGGRGGRGGAHAGGQSSQRPERSGQDMEQDFISFSNSGNNFHMLKGAFGRNETMSLEGSGLEDGEITDDSDMDSDDIDVDDLDMYEAQDMMINVEVSQPLRNRARLSRAEVMFTVPQAVAIYKEMHFRGFPLPASTAVRYGAPEGVSPDSASYLSLAPSLISPQLSVSSATSGASPVEMKEGLGRDYVFDFGKYFGKRFEDVPENYLRTIGGQLDVYEPKHPGLREAFDYFRPGQARSAGTAPTSRKQPSKKQPPSNAPANPQSQAKSLLPVAPKRKIAKGLSQTWAFRKGPHKGKRLVEVPENYLRTLEGMPSVVAKWPGFKAALQDFNQRTGRKGRI